MFWWRTEENCPLYILKYPPFPFIWNNFYKFVITWECKSWEYVIAGLKAGVSYKFKVQAVNMYGVELLSKPTS